MDAVLDKFGRIVIPKAIRDALGLRPGSHLTLDENGREIVARPAEPVPCLKSKGGWLVYTGELMGDASGAIDAVRLERIKQAAGVSE